MADRKYGENKLVDAHPFRTQDLCQEYLIKEARKFEQETGGSKDQGALEEGRRFHRKQCFCYCPQAGVWVDPFRPGRLFPADRNMVPFFKIYAAVQDPMRKIAAARPGMALDR